MEVKVYKKVDLLVEAKDLELEKSKVHLKVHGPTLGSSNRSGFAWESFIDGIRRRITVGDDEWQILQFY